MIDREPDTRSRGGVGVLIPEQSSDPFPARVVARRRRASRQRHGHRHSRKWIASSRRRYLRTFVVCTGVLLLMAVGLYFGLAHQEVAPTDGSLRARAPLLALAA